MSFSLFEIENSHHYVEYKKPTFDPVITNNRLENKPYLMNLHRSASLVSDKVAYLLVKALRIPADLFFAKKYGHRAIVLETVGASPNVLLLSFLTHSLQTTAAVPGMVAGVFRHLRSLRSMSHDGGWIPELLDEAENERMHLLTFIKIQKPTLFERVVVAVTQGTFFFFFSFSFIL